MLYLSAPGSMDTTRCCLPTESRVIAGPRPRLCESLLCQGVRLHALGSRVVFPQEFNQLLERYETKGAMLSHLTLELIEQVLQPLRRGRSQSFATTRRRNCYGPLLMQHFPIGSLKSTAKPAEERLSVRADRAANRYFLLHEGRAIHARRIGLHGLEIPAELAMRAFNDFWRCRVPNLLPTAGILKMPYDSKPTSPRSNEIWGLMIIFFGA